MRKKLAIVSSYNELCGNATYTEVLRREFSKRYDVTILPLNVGLLNTAERHLRRLADEHINEMCRLLPTFDFVNIQFEAGLYGAYPSQIINRTSRLIQASRNVIVTMHRVDLPVSPFDKQFIKLVLSGRMYTAAKSFKNRRYFASIYSRLVRFMQAERRRRSVNIVVHTKRERWNIENVFGFAPVYDHPLTFLNHEQRSEYPKKFNKASFRQKHGLSESDISIGIFGFLNENKGHETAIKALAYLPDEYTLLICGAQHPATIAPDTRVDRYISRLLSLIQKNGGRPKEPGTTPRRPLSDRVRFVGELDDERFIEALYCCDLTVLPYMETNQSGSGIAALALESGSRAIFSRNRAFMELAQYYPNAFPWCDIGNYLELASKITTYVPVYDEALSAAIESFNVESNIQMYERIFEEAGDA